MGGNGKNKVKSLSVTSSPHLGVLGPRLGSPKRLPIVITIVNPAPSSPGLSDGSCTWHEVFKEVLTSPLAHPGPVRWRNMFLVKADTDENQNMTRERSLLGIVDQPGSVFKSK